MRPESRQPRESTKPGADPPEVDRMSADSNQEGEVGSDGHGEATQRIADRQSHELGRRSRPWLCRIA